MGHPDQELIPSRRVIVDGEDLSAADASVSVFDSAVLRGYGCFEAIRAYGGVPFRAEAHLARLGRSAAILALSLPDGDRIRDWVDSVAAEGGDCIVRVVVTGGSDTYAGGSGPHVIVLAESLPEPKETIRLLPVTAPWHPAGRSSELTGAKTLSYAPNMAAMRTAREAGFDDALLLAVDETVLEGPTYSIGWFADGVFNTPALELGVLASITRAAALEVLDASGVAVEEVVAPLAALLAAEEVCAMSTAKEIVPVVAVGEKVLEAGGRTAELRERFLALVAEDTNGT